jgi:hypothetical protein
MNFKIGQRVRVICIGSRNFGKAATISTAAKVERILCVDGVVRNLLSYRVAVDGIGAFNPANGTYWAYEPHELEPLTPPSLAQELMTRSHAPEWSCPGPVVA